MKKNGFVSTFDRLKNGRRHRTEGERGHHYRRFMCFAAAALVIALLAASPQVRTMLCAAGETLGRLTGIRIESSRDGLEVVDYGYERVAVRKTISPVNKSVTIGDFALEWQDLIWQSTLSDAYSDFSETFLLPVKVSYQGDRETYGDYLPPYQLQFNVVGYKDNKKVVEFAFRHADLYSEIGDEMYPYMDTIEYYPTKFINGKHSPTNAYLMGYYGEIIDLDTDLLADHYKQYRQAFYDVNDFVYGDVKDFELGYSLSPDDTFWDDGSDPEIDVMPDPCKSWNEGAKNVCKQLIRESDRMSKAERAEALENDFALYYDSDGWSAYSSADNFTGYAVISALHPDRFEITTAELSTYTATGYEVVKTSTYYPTDTVYDSFVNRFVVKWKDMQKADYRVVNRDYTDRLKKETPAAAEALSGYTPVAFRHVG